jgi:hypothetical protein
MPRLVVATAAAALLVAYRAPQGWATSTAKPRLRLLTGLQGGGVLKAANKETERPRSGRPV